MAGPVVVILAAGQGTRMRSSVPKLLHPLCGRPVIAWPIAAAREAGAERIVLIDSPERRLQELAGDDVRIVVQPQPDGTGGALRAALPELAQLPPATTVLVLYGDGPLVSAQTLSALTSAHEATRAAATIATVTLSDPTGLGRIVRGPDGTVERIVETKVAGDASELQLRIREINTGIYAFEAGPLGDALGRIAPDNAQNELYLPDVVPALREAERTVDTFELADPVEFSGINDRVQLAAVTAAAQRRICERHMRAGVTIVNPAATTIDVEVQIGSDSVIEPFTTLRGTTSIGHGTTIGPGCTLIDTTVGDGATALHAYVTGATIGDRVNVGPFAYLRPGTILREGSKAGTFVEIKNSDIGAGTKVPHLSYIGDATVGEQTNLGAATITANYDGYAKHRTTIGSRVKTGVDNTLMAPVTLGDDVTTAAGSVIGQDVPSGALAGSPGVARKAQRTVEGYAERRARRAAEESRTTEEETA